MSKIMFNIRDNPESSNEMGQFIRKIKNLINKFYSSPLIAFQFVYSFNFRMK